MYIDALDPENDEDPENLDPEDIYEELKLSSYIPQLGGVMLGSVDEENAGSRISNFASPYLTALQESPRVEVQPWALVLLVQRRNMKSRSRGTPVTVSP